jgi:hypothetical protein
MTYISKNGLTIAVAEQDLAIAGVRDMMDLMASASYLEHADAITLRKESLPDVFFDLKTGFAGEVLQKFSNYRMKLAIIGDFSVYSSKSLRDFIYESNKGRQIFFKPDLDSALAALSE